MISKNHLIELSEIRDPLCVTILIKTHRGGKESLQKEDERLFSLHLEEAKKRLINLGWTTDSAENHLKPAYDLLEDGSFWRELSDGLAVFITPDIFEKHTVPLSFNNETYVSTELLIKPLMPLFQENGNFFLLALSKDNIQFYSAERYSITQLELSASSPNQLEDVVGYDYKEENLQGRSAGKNSTMYHGHGDDKRSEKEELKMYFKSIVEEISYYTKQYPNAPLLVAGLDENFSLFKEVSSNNNLMEENVSVNPNSKDLFLLHEMACEKMNDYFQAPLEKSTKRYNDLQESKLISNNLKDIIQYSLDGRIDVLFLENEFDAFGTYNPANQNLNLGERSELKNVSLSNLLVRETLHSKGEVFVLNENQMPNQAKDICCILRY